MHPSVSVDKGAGELDMKQTSLLIDEEARLRRPALGWQPHHRGGPDAPHAIELLSFVTDKDKGGVVSGREMLRRVSDQDGILDNRHALQLFRYDQQWRLWSRVQRGMLRPTNAQNERIQKPGAWVTDLPLMWRGHILVFPGTIWTVGSVRVVPTLIWANQWWNPAYLDLGRSWSTVCRIVRAQPA